MAKCPKAQSGVWEVKNCFCCVNGIIEKMSLTNYFLLVTFMARVCFEFFIESLTE